MFLPADLAKSKAEFDIDLASIDLASEDSEKEIRDRLWFDTAKFPGRALRLDVDPGLGGDKYEIAGALTIKGIKRDVVVPVAVKKDAAGNRVAEGSFSLHASRLQDRRRGCGPTPRRSTNEVIVRVRIVLPPAG